MAPKGGLEPSRVSPPPPQDGVVSMPPFSAFAPHTRVTRLLRGQRGHTPRSPPPIGLYSFCIVDTHKQGVSGRTTQSVIRGISHTGRTKKGQRVLRRPSSWITENPRVPSSILGGATMNIKGLRHIAVTPFWCNRAEGIPHPAPPREISPCPRFDRRRTKQISFDLRVKEGCNINVFRYTDGPPATNPT